VIETDGLSHQFEEVIKKDKEKDEYLLSLEISVLRFNDDEVMNDIENISRVIETWISVNGYRAKSAIIPLPPSKGENQKPSLKYVSI
jgi:very-short-patch-repair endonuclease